MRLQGKRALVTAAGQGIGRATALRFASEGADVLATDINEAALARLEADAERAGGRLTTLRLDVTDKREVEALAANESAFDVLFNCAGYVHHGTILDCDEDAWAFSLNLNVTSMYRLIRALLPAMLDAGGASIINMASAASSVKGVPNRFVYGTTKAAVIGLTKAVAADFVERGIRCNAICPGTIESPSLEQRIAEQARKGQVSVDVVRQAFVARQPMGRVGTADEVAALALYLASDESAFTTGAIHLIDGGWSN
ncbi:SDR family oxidoreductase [Burkholderia pseudomultivorans]|uniref:2-keto-3-deoxy-L-fuconate dehydrogenase n=1 Tax=Burkholderia pseudomultivorans TaxID=1207504 RepID=A0A132E874_9BURK|nr:SDR family oxidoreductase [Burkholderia pseudomultivorans]KWF19888.1 NAD(P)-dependent oxidoreductase [Burkholderia pseudomultivorans]MDR8729175.1 2-keto-3-deoxy-L-fuconate dehydrogenase [Burkholderia pseudomultivorans]MDR8737779.1 2-keto-3-deoxy-L-fuconate dehydrogenase [Burkholderia pseudomultivorans]MDR8743947.1 2-keto-3-deoxy-L-fuconate dehydrogenase [Burkholderia pseudomultivorans]MDR8755272.1 2-keto-3-deoxy-L-fuconate dehydrogenase [Burkholderia pseudomultivorans]